MRRVIDYQPVNDDVASKIIEMLVALIACQMLLRDNQH